MDLQPLFAAWSDGGSLEFPAFEHFEKVSCHGVESGHIGIQRELVRLCRYCDVELRSPFSAIAFGADDFVDIGAVQFVFPAAVCPDPDRGSIHINTEHPCRKNGTEEKNSIGGDHDRPGDDIFYIKYPQDRACVQNSK